MLEILGHLPWFIFDEDSPVETHKQTYIFSDVNIFLLVQKCFVNKSFNKRAVLFNFY